jgi:hypothetical protein
LKYLWKTSLGVQSEEEKLRRTPFIAPSFQTPLSYEVKQARAFRTVAPALNQIEIV